MKEATGELSSSVIVLTLIAALAAFFFTVVWPFYEAMYAVDESCANAVCDIGYNGNGLANCYAPEDPSKEFECPYRG